LLNDYFERITLGLLNLFRRWNSRQDLNNLISLSLKPILYAKKPLKELLS
jgi:hypothetical protein